MRAKAVREVERFVVGCARVLRDEGLSALDPPHIRPKVIWSSGPSPAEEVAMGKITVSGTMSHSVDRVWSMLDDFGSVYLWSAGVESSPTIEGTPERGVGAERLCTLYDGNRISERVVESVDKRKLVVDIYDTTMPLKSARGRFDIEETSDSGTLVRMTFEYVVKYGILGKAMDALMIERSLKKSLDNLLAALDEHLATGVHIQKGWQPTSAAA